ncbi:MAG: DsrE family protein [Candidatus Thiodiazotropha sp. (ex Monitilora ramsayi)]|nr:DsrE family protein [Candidatus Thiodiazotropha sp. (ex Monitilora ramsayi)]
MINQGYIAEDAQVKYSFSKRVVLIIAGLLMLSGQAIGAEGYGKQKVVYHINYDDPKTQKSALRNIQNHINAVGAENLELKVVLHGDGLSLLIYPDSLAKLAKFKQANAGEEMAAKIDGLKSQGVNFQVCGNTVRGRKVELESDLYDVEAGDVVPSGVAELSHLQAQGYTYIKP